MTIVALSDWPIRVFLVDSKQHNRSKGKGEWFFCAYIFNHASSWGRLLMLISYLGSIIKGRVSPALDHCDWYR